MNIKNPVSTVDCSALIALFDKRKDCKTKEDFIPLINEIAEEIVMRSSFYTLVRMSEQPVMGENGIAMMPKGAKLSFALLQAGDGKKFYPVFTSSDELIKLHKGEEAPSTLTVNFDNLAEMIVDQKNADGFVIDPFGANFVVDAANVKRWREKKQLTTQGHTNQVISQDAKVSVAATLKYPDGLVEAITEQAKQLKGVKTIWVGVMEMNGEKSWLAIVDYEGDRDATFNPIGRTAMQYIGDMPLNMVSAADKLGKDAIDHLVPIYQK